GKLLTIKDNYVLVEMSYINPPFQLYDYIFKLQVAGYIPVLAHPERYVFYHSDVSNYAKLKKAGCYFQMNLLSATGYYGKEVAKIADQLLKNDMIDFVGSDFHHKQHVESFSNPIIIKETVALKKAAENNCIFN
ncbi:MAG: protein-tyrosine phosphatase, partial [Flavobacterium sp.]